MSRFAMIGMALLTAVSASVAGAEVTVKAVSGIVRVTSPGTPEFTQAIPGQVLVEGMEIATGEDSRVTIELGSNNMVKLRANAKLVIKLTQAKVSRFDLIAGKLKGIFSGLRWGEKFELGFAGSDAIASVKGTEFTAEVREDGTHVIHTLFGAIELKDGELKRLVPQGCGAAFGQAVAKAARLLKDAEIEDGLANWSDDRLPSESQAPNQRQADENARRGEMREVVQEMRDQIDQSHEQTTLIREEDFAAGRTLRDVHGNLTRVDQRIGRPDPYTVQFVNLVKRDTYAYKGGFTYRGGSGPRLDYLEARMQFSHALPSKLTDWPGFFEHNVDGEGLDVKPVQASLVLSNGAVGDPNRDKIEQRVEFLSDTSVDEFGNRTARPGEDDEAVTFLINGAAVATEPSDRLDVLLGSGDLCSACERFEADGEDSDDLWGRGVTAVYQDNVFANGRVDPEEYYAGNLAGYLNVEGFVIDNNGKVLNVDDFMSGSRDPITIAKNTAAQGIISYTMLPGGQGADLFGRNRAGSPTNIDIVITPDIALAAAQKFIDEGKIPEFDDENEDPLAGDGLQGGPLP